MADFKTKVDYSSNRQIKQFQFTETTLSGATTFGVPDMHIPENHVGPTINIDALQFIRSRGFILDDGNQADGYVFTASGDTGYGYWKESPSSSTMYDITATVAAGDIDPNDVVSSGSTLSDFINQLIAPVLLPTVQQNASLSVGGFSEHDAEIGSLFSDTLTYTFNQGLIDSKNDYQDISLVGPVTGDTFVGTNISTSGVITNAPITSGSNDWSVTVFYSAGSGAYYDSSGNPQNNLFDDRESGDISRSTSQQNITVTGKYKYWYDMGAAGTTANDSSSVRALTDDFFVGNVSFDIIIPSGTTEVAIYIPDTMTLDEVTYAESSDADVTGTFFPPTFFDVADGSGSTLVPYKKHKATIGGIGYLSVATYQVKLLL